MTAPTWCAACTHPTPQPTYRACPRCGGTETTAVGPVRETVAGERRHGGELYDDIVLELIAEELTA